MNTDLVAWGCAAFMGFVILCSLEDFVRAVWRMLK